nr:endonuclease/exonuclease/phosphatase family protein [uncultured Cohaesibacter sp.]
MATTIAAQSKDYSVVSWNVENWGSSDPAQIAVQLRDHFDQIDIFGLSEVNRDSDFALYADYASRDEDGTYHVIAGTTGNNIKLGIIFKENKFELLDTFELTDLQFGSGGRAPLVANFRDKENDQQFLFVVNHLHRGNEKKRLSQAIGLREWARMQSLPIIAVGDYNFDYDVDLNVGNVAFDAFVDQGIFEWLMPETLVATNWSDTKPADGQNDYNSVLDFIFVSGADIDGVSTIFVRDNDFPDDEYTSDHRPVVALLTVDGSEVLGDLDNFTPLRPADRSRELAVFSMQPRTVQSGVKNLPFDQKLEFDNSRIVETFSTDQMQTIQSQLNDLKNQIQNLQNAQ